MICPVQPDPGIEPYRRDRRYDSNGVERHGCCVAGERGSAGGHFVETVHRAGTGPI
jgi:hypothetical protein